MNNGLPDHPSLFLSDVQCLLFSHESLWIVWLCLPDNHLIDMERLPLGPLKNCSSLGWSNLFSSASLHTTCAPCPWWFWWPSSWLAQVHHPFTGGPKTGHFTIFHAWSSKWLVEQTNIPFPPVSSSYTPVSTAQKLVCFHWCQGTSQTHIWLLVVPQSVMSSLHLCNEFFLPWGRTLQLCSVSQGTCQPIPPTCPGPSEWQPCSQACQLLLPWSFPGLAYLQSWQGTFCLLFQVTDRDFLKDTCQDKDVDISTCNQLPGRVQINPALRLFERDSLTGYSASDSNPPSQTLKTHLERKDAVTVIGLDEVKVILSSSSDRAASS